MAQVYSKMEGVDYDETFAHVAHMESIRVLLALMCHLKFKLYQMDVKTALLNGFLKEDVYVEKIQVCIAYKTYTNHTQWKINGSTSFAIDNMYYVNFRI